jgi:dihydroorotase
MMLIAPFDSTMSTSTLIIRQSQVCMPDGQLQLTDVLVRGGSIELVAEQIPITADQELDGRGLTLLPGVIDPQVHFREPGLEHKENLFTNLDFINVETD